MSLVIFQAVLMCDTGREVRKPFCSGERAELFIREESAAMGLDCAYQGGGKFNLASCGEVVGTAMVQEVKL